MDFHVVLLGADTLFAEINVFTPPAADEVILFANGSANRARFEQVSNDVARNGAPTLHRVVFFPEFRHFILAQHKRLPVVSLMLDAIGGPIAT
jgi:hypothetical protein